MKKFSLFTLFPAMALMALNPSASASGLSFVGPLTINWKVAQQVSGVESPPVLSTTHTSKGTNYISTYKFTSSTTPFSGASLIDLLTNSFKTNFAKGAVQLVTDGSSVYLVDKTGTNVVLDISSVLTVSTGNGIYSGAEVKTVSVPKAPTLATTTNTVGTASVVNFVQLNYDDSNLITNNVTRFQYYSMSTGADEISYTNILSESGKENFNLQGVGSGTILGTYSIIWGTVTGSSKGTENDY